MYRNKMDRKRIFLEVELEQKQVTLSSGVQVTEKHSRTFFLTSHCPPGPRFPFILHQPFPVQ